jgi:hypothetical protein
MNGDTSGMHGTTLGNEPGAIDNRLSLSESDFPMIEEWQDNQTYSLSELGDAKLRQISPGEFEVMPGSPPTEAGEEPGTTEQPEAPPNNEEKPADEYPNPAVARMMRSR